MKKSIKQTTIPLTEFAKFPNLTAWESLAYWLIISSGLTLDEAAALTGKTTNNIRKTFYVARGKMPADDSEQIIVGDD